MANKTPPREGAFHVFKTLFTSRGETTYDALRSDSDQTSEEYDLGRDGDTTKTRKCSFRSCFTWLHALSPLKFLGSKDEAARPLHPTAWLDGLRGVAAFLVVFHHASLLWWSWDIHYGWGIHDKRRFVQLPFIRVAVSGLPLVMIFFVVSGFSLSYSPLKHMHQGRRAEALETLASTAIRRWTRVYLPAAALGVFAAFAMYAGFFHTASTYNAGAANSTREITVPSGFWAQMVQWAVAFWRMSDPLDWRQNRGTAEYHYDPNLWTLSVEFDCSMVVFAALLCVSKLRTMARIITLSVVLAISFWNNHEWRSLFLAGLWIADLHHLSRRRQQQQQPKSEVVEEAEAHGMLEEPQSHMDQGPCLPLSTMTTTTTSPAPSARALTTWLARAGAILAMMVSLHLLGIPEDNMGADDTPGYRWLRAIVPNGFSGRQFWCPLGTALMVFTIDRFPFLQAIFTTRFAQYLGRISYSMYLIHGCLLWTMGLHLGRISVETFSPVDDVQYFWCVAMAFVGFLAVLLLLSDLAATYIDKPVVAMGKRVYGKLVVAHRS